MSEEYKKNCHFCVHLGSDSAGGDYDTEWWPICEKYPYQGKTNLKSFPFTKEQGCHVASFWAVLEIDKELKSIYDKSQDHEQPIIKMSAYKLFEKKYLQEDK